MIKEWIAANMASPLPQHLLAVHNYEPPFTLWISYKGPVLNKKHETILRIGSALVFRTRDGREERKIVDAIPAKYGKFRAGEFNVLVIVVSSDPIEEAIEHIEPVFDSPRPKLSAIVLLSNWQGRSRVVTNPHATHPLSSEALEGVRRAAMLLPPRP